MARSHASDARLSWSEGGVEHTLELDGERGPVTVGRSSSADVPLDHPKVSRRHAEIAWDGGAWVVRDAGSLNGTRVGPSLVGAGRALADGDVVHCGPVALAFSWPAGRLAAPQTSKPATVVGALLPPVTPAEAELLQELCRPYRQGEDPRTSSREPAANAQIAERLRLSESGVRQRLKRLYPKLGLAGDDAEKRRELAALAIELGLVRLGA
jgi:predicted component of type VI protein secretion system